VSELHQVARVGAEDVNVSIAFTSRLGKKVEEENDDKMKEKKNRRNEMLDVRGRSGERRVEGDVLLIEMKKLPFKDWAV
jgi:hypothetical protein